MSLNHDEPCNSDESECAAEFAILFPREFWNVAVMAELAPLGWEKSPLRLAFHPTLEQVYEESLAIHRNLGILRRSDGPAPPEPTLAEIQADYRETPLDPEREVRDLFGRCLWDIFSDNHEVITPQGKILDIGSFRVAGAFIADYLNGIIPEARYDYMDFYLGSLWLAGRVDLTAVYSLIFRRLKEHGFDWVYHFPRLRLVDLRPLHDALADDSKPEWLDYSPEKAFAEEKADDKRDAEAAKLRESLDAAYRESVEHARRSPPPSTVLAYRAVYGHDPRGWPPDAEDFD